MLGVILTVDLRTLRLQSRQWPSSMRLCFYTLKLIYQQHNDQPATSTGKEVELCSFNGGSLSNLKHLQRRSIQRLATGDWLSLTPNASQR